MSKRRTVEFEPINILAEHAGYLARAIYDHDSVEDGGK